MSSAAPGPLQTVRTSCAAVAAKADHVTIHDSEIVRFLAEIDDERWAKVADVPDVPLRLEGEQRVNFWSLMALIQFGSGFRRELHAASGRGASDTIMYGLFGLQLGMDRITADFLASISLHAVASAFDLQIDRETEIMPGVGRAVPSPGP